jgi:hypothetical protein
VSKNSSLYHLYSGQVGGYRILSNESIRLFDKQKGLIVDIRAGYEESVIGKGDPVLFTHDTTFLSDSLCIIRSIDKDYTIQSTLYTIREDLSLERKLLLPNNITEFSFTPSGDVGVFVIKEDTGAQITLFNTNSLKTEILSTLPISEWIPFITEKQEIYVQSKTSSEALSGVYILINKKLKQVFRPTKGLTALVSPTGNTIFYSILNPTLVSLLTTYTKEEGGIQTLQQTKSLQVQTFAEKCIWDTGEENLFCGAPVDYASTIDNWYLGTQTTNDRVYSFNVKTGLEKFIELDSTQATIDIIKPTTSPSKEYLYFINKKDLSLWSTRI